MNEQTNLEPLQHLIAINHHLLSAYERAAATANMGGLTEQLNNLKAFHLQNKVELIKTLREYEREGRIKHFEFQESVQEKAQQTRFLEAIKHFSEARPEEAIGNLIHLEELALSAYKQSAKMLPYKEKVISKIVDLQYERIKKFVLSFQRHQTIYEIGS